MIYLEHYNPDKAGDMKQFRAAQLRAHGTKTIIAIYSS
jgi:hypothetical protein